MQKPRRKGSALAWLEGTLGAELPHGFLASSEPIPSASAKSAACHMLRPSPSSARAVDRLARQLDELRSLDAKESNGGTEEGSEALAG